MLSISQPFPGRTIHAVVGLRPLSRLHTHSPYLSLARPNLTHSNLTPPRHRTLTNSTRILSPSFRVPRFVLLPLPSRLLTLTALGATSIVAYYTYDPFRHFCAAVTRCSRAGWVGATIAADYKWSLRKSRKFENEEERRKAKSAVHKRSAVRVYEALKKNGGIYIKLVSGIYLQVVKAGADA